MDAIPSLKEYAAMVKNNNQVQQPVTNPVQQPVKTIDKKKLAVGIAAGLGITALVVGGLLYKHKIDSAKVKQLAEHIDYKPAQTLEEAINFGKENLGIHRYKGFQEADLDVVNWINEGLTTASNKAKGKLFMPKKVKYVNDIGKCKFAGAMNGFGTLSISKQSVLDQRENSKTIIKLLNKFEETPEQVNEYLDKLPIKKLIIFEMNSVKHLPSEYRNEFIKKYYTDTSFGTHTLVHHELGHLQHQHNVDYQKIYCALGKPEEIKGIKLSKEAQELRNLFESKIDIAKKVSTYASESPDEFVAEVFANLCAGVEFPQETLDLYQKLGGVMI